MALSLHEELKKQAIAERRTRSDLLRQAISEYLYKAQLRRAQLTKMVKDGLDTTDALSNLL